MGGQSLKQRPPTGREFGRPGDLQRAEDRRSMSYAGGRGCNYVEGPHHAGRKVVEDGCF